MNLVMNLAKKAAEDSTLNYLVNFYYKEFYIY